MTAQTSHAWPVSRASITCMQTPSSLAQRTSLSDCANGMAWIASTVVLDWSTHRHLIWLVTWNGSRFLPWISQSRSFIADGVRLGLLMTAVPGRCVHNDLVTLRLGIVSKAPNLDPEQWTGSEPRLGAPLCAVELPAQQFAQLPRHPLRNTRASGALSSQTVMIHCSACLCVRRYSQIARNRCIRNDLQQHHRRAYTERITIPS